MKAIKTRLAALGFLEFAVWGSYLVSLGLYLNAVGLGDYIFWFYTVQGIVSLVMPGIVGMVADRFIPAQKMFSLCHVLAGGFMLGAGFYAMRTRTVRPAVCAIHPFGSFLHAHHRLEQLSGVQRTYTRWA